MHPEDFQTLQRPRVLVVEDEPRLRDLLMDVIPEMGFTVSAVRSAEEAIRTLEATPREIVILDLQLPVMNGMDLFAQIRQRWPATEVIILTGFGDLESARAAIRLDVVDFLSKPCHLREIEVALDRARRRLVNALATRDSDKSPDKPGDTPETLEEIERQQILKALERHGGNRTRAAAELGISRRTLHYRLASYGQIRQPADREQRSS